MAAGSLVVSFVHSFCFADEPTEPACYLPQIWVKKWNLCTVFTYCSEIKFEQKFWLQNLDLCHMSILSLLQVQIPNNIFSLRLENLG